MSFPFRYTVVIDLDSEQHDWLLATESACPNLTRAELLASMARAGIMRQIQVEQEWPEGRLTKPETKEIAECQR